MYRYFTDLDFRRAMQGGLKMLSISLVVDSPCRKSICGTQLCVNRVEM